ncbi:MAG: cation:proton antiporter [Thermoprotei archaeon]|nr:MAG: cation:proton antiporter [Thermoprotei archaeon]
MSMVNLIVILGLIMIIVGAFFEVVGALGILRLKGFFSRIHAVTASAIGGAALPLLGVALVSASAPWMIPQGYYLAGICLTATILILLLAPAGAHALARSAYLHKGVRKEFVYDDLIEHLKKRRR